MRAPSYDIKQDTYYNINTCYKCNKMVERLTSQCTADPNHSVFGMRYGRSHWKDCKSKKMCCINCQSDHSTLAMKCPKREVIIYVRKAGKEHVSSTYTSVAKKHMSASCSNTVKLQSPTSTNISLDVQHQDIHMYNACAHC